MTSKMREEWRHRPLGMWANAPIEYYETDRGYFLPAYREGTDVTFYENFLQQNRRVLLFPNGMMTPKGFRRLDGVWIEFEDELTVALLMDNCFFIERGSYPRSVYSYLLEWSALDDRRSLVYGLYQVLVAGCVGELSPYAFGYDPLKRDSTQADFRYANLYCGDLALWEAEADDFYPHTLIGLSHFMLDVRGRAVPVVTYLEELCYRAGSRGYPTRKRLELAFEIAKAIASGELKLLDSPPCPYTRVPEAWIKK